MATQVSVPISHLKSTYDVIVIGSGYGGGVAACRLAEAGARVCVLERGREWLKKEFPESTYAYCRELQVHTTRGVLGSPDKLYDWRFDGDALLYQASGLGGGSLINCSVSLRPKLSVFDKFPEEFRRSIGSTGSDSLSQAYERAEQMLRVSSLEEAAKEAYSRSHTLLASLATSMGREIVYPDLQVNLQKRTDPLSGNVQEACTGCGNCTSGCNLGAKNSIDKTYLERAKAAGAEIFCQVQVEHIKKASDGAWVVSMTPLAESIHSDRSKLGNIVHHGGPFIRAPIVILAAGTLGTAQILFQSKKEGLSISKRLGQSFGGNGDIVECFFNGDQEVSELGVRDVEKERPPGPTISAILSTSSLHEQEKRAFKRSLSQRLEPASPKPRLGRLMSSNSRRDLETTLLQNAVTSIPMAGLLNLIGLLVTLWLTLTYLFHLFLSFVAWNPPALTDLYDTLTSSLAPAWRLLKGFIYGPLAPGTGPRHTQVLLSVGHDSSKGIIRPHKDGRVAVKLPRGEHFNPTGHSLLEDIAGLRTLRPLKDLLGFSAFVAHPLGGCCVGEVASVGVVNHACQVFAGEEGSAVHKGLYVCDGSVLPGSLAANPSITIAAIAERAMKMLTETTTFGGKRSRCSELDIEDCCAAIPGDKQRKETNDADTQPRIAVHFTEAMVGMCRLTNQRDQSQPSRASQAPCSLLISLRWIEGPMVDGMIRGTFLGTIDIPVLSGQPLLVTSGSFSFFKEVEGHRRFVYEADVASRDGKHYTFLGMKTLRSGLGASFSLWTDTSTLEFKVSPKSSAKRATVVSGVLRITPWALAKSISTMRCSPAGGPTGKRHPFSIREQLLAISAFIAWFVGGLLGHYLLPQFLHWRKPLQQLDILEDGEVYNFQAADGAPLRLTRFNGGKRGVVVMAPGLTVPAEMNFAWNVPGHNLAGFLQENGYDVWVFSYRSCIAGFTEKHTLDEVAKYDWPAGVDKVLKVTGVGKVDVLAHCMGSTSLFMAVLGGHLNNKVRSIISAAVATHPRVLPAQALKVHLRLDSILSSLGLQTLPVTGRGSPLLWLPNKLLDMVALSVTVLLGFTPLKDICLKSTCCRSSFVFGPSITHQEISKETHALYHQMLLSPHLATLTHIGECVKAGKLVSRNGEDIYMPHADRLKVPITFITGASNRLFLPKGLEHTLQWLKAANPDCASEYVLHKVEGQHHLGMYISTHARQDVYPLVLAHLEEQKKKALAEIDCRPNRSRHAWSI